VEGDELNERATSLTAHGPIPIGFRATPIAWIQSMKVQPDELDADLSAPDLWNGVHTVHVPRSLWDSTENEDDEIRDPVSLALFWLEETLDNGAWMRWTQRPDGSFEPPQIDALMQELLSSPLEQTAYLERFQTILDTVGRQIVFYVNPDQWHESPAPETAWDPPKVLAHAPLVRMAPFTIHDVSLDQDAITWHLTLESVHFPERRRSVHIRLPVEKMPEDMNPPGFLWWNLRSACEAWFDLHYSHHIPEDERLDMYSYGGWHQEDNGSWTLDLLQGY